MEKNFSSKKYLLSAHCCTFDATRGEMTIASHSALPPVVAIFGPSEFSEGFLFAELLQEEAKRTGRIFYRKFGGNGDLPLCLEEVRQKFPGKKFEAHIVGHGMRNHIKLEGSAYSRKDVQKEHFLDVEILFLHSCNTGEKNGMAQAISDKANVKVFAPKGAVVAEKLIPFLYSGQMHVTHFDKRSNYITQVFDKTIPEMHSLGEYRVIEILRGALEDGFHMSWAFPFGEILIDSPDPKIHEEGVKWIEVSACSQRYLRAAYFLESAYAEGVRGIQQNKGQASIWGEYADYLEKGME